MDIVMAILLPLPNGDFDHANTENHSKEYLLILKRLSENSELFGVSLPSSRALSASAFRGAFGKSTWTLDPCALRSFRRKSAPLHLDCRLPIGRFVRW